MTISEAISEWLSYFGGVTVDTNHVSDGCDRYGLFKSPARTISNNIDTTYQITEHYQLLARFHSVSEEDRKDSDELLEKITYWADDYAFNYEYPALDGKRKIINIQISGNPYPLSTESDDMLYQLSINITYERERGVL